MNMAMDEALLQTATQPTLRFYGWRQPSLSFGYFGRFADVSAEAPRRELVRRWTGGGIVLHGDDLTYSIILPRPNAAALPSPGHLYHHIHAAIRDALGAQTEVALATANSPKISDACFANAVIADVVMEGQKIAGAAQRRTRVGLLHQGSIQYAHLPVSFREDFAAALSEDFEVAPPKPGVIKRAQELAARKYGTADWLRQR
jgi:lipoate-protein ligase A